MKRSGPITAILMLCVFTACSENELWTNLIKKDLSAWEQLNGTAPFKLEDGVVTGTTVTGSPNSFLCTKGKYGDFILEFETWFDPQMNSGVQFRSESRPDYQDGRVHGYQVEMDPSPRAWSGGIYDEARRGWLYTLDLNPEGRKALRVGEWNHYKVEERGTDAWRELVATSKFSKVKGFGEAEEGRILLQDHSDRVWFKNIKIREL